MPKRSRSFLTLALRSASDKVLSELAPPPLLLLLEATNSRGYCPNAKFLVMLNVKQCSFLSPIKNVLANLEFKNVNARITSVVDWRK